MPKILIAFYSWSGNTKKIAQLIQKYSGGTLFEIIPSNPYPPVFHRCTEQARQEIQSGFKPALQDTVDNIKDYDTVFIGTPNWWSTLAPPVSSFLSEHNLAGKTVIPFCTHGTGGKARCLADIASQVPKSKILDGFSVAGDTAADAEKDVEIWLQKINLKNKF